MAAVIAVATGGVYNTQARKNTKPPYVIFQIMSKLDEHSFNGRYANSLYMVKAVSQSEWPKEALDVDTEIDTVMEDASLTVTGFSPLLCRRESDFVMAETVNGQSWQHAGGVYRIIADQS